MNYFDHLPLELISLIGDYIHKKDVYTCLFINKTFYKTILPILWKQLNVLNQATFSAIDLNSSCGKYVQQISFGSFLTDTLLEEWIQYVPFLTHIELIHGGGGAGGITDTGFQHVTEYCPHLTHVSIRGTRVTQRSIVALSQYCHQLRLIELQYCSHMANDDLFSALASCTFLETLILTRCDTDNNNNNNLVKLMGLEHLTTLIIQDASFDLTPIFTTTSATCCPRLTHLYLDPCSTLNDSMIIPFLQSHPYLTHLEFLSSQITDLTLDAMTMYLPGIKTLGLDYTVGITPLGVRRLVKQCPKLMLMTTFGCQIISDDFPEANEMYFELEDDDLLHVTRFEEEELEEIRSGFFDDD